MCRERVIGIERQRGLGLISAIFLIVVVAAIAVAVVSLVRSQSQAFAEDVLSEKAFLAAQTGGEVGLNRVFAPIGVPSCATWNFDLDRPGLEKCSARVVCSATAVNGTTQYTLESAGRCGTANDIAERHIVVRAAP